jgi:hypothetical protein
MSGINSIDSTNSQQEMNVVQRVFGVFFSPRKTFEDIDRKPDWVVPMVIVVIIAVLFTIIIMPIALPQQMDKQREKFEERGMSDEEIERAMEMGGKFGRIIGPIGAAVGSVVYLLAIAGIFMFVGNTILGGKTTFKKLVSVVCYSSLIGSLNSIILLPMILSRKTMEVHFSLAAFMSADASETFLYQLLKKIDLFAFWQIVVAGIGVAVIYKFTTKKAIAMVASLYVLYMVISLAWTAIF